jgi:hypothetical protein
LSLEKVTWTSNISVSRCLTPTAVEPAAADILPIYLGQEYTIKSWTEEPIVTDSLVIPKDSFALATGQEVTASAIAYLEMSYQDPLKLKLSPGVSSPSGSIK